MKLSKILDSCKVEKIFGSQEIEIESITDNSKKAKKGYLFIAVKGIHFDSHKKITNVINKGVACVVGEVNPQEDWLNKVTYIKVNDSRETLSKMSANWFGNPSKKLKIIGVTGTDGKTTTCSMIYSALVQANKKVGLVTSVAAKINGKDYDTGFHVTNPEQYQLQKYLAKMVSEKCEYAVLEVTSHGIKQKRIYGIDFDISVITNITPEHLDYHRTFKDYRNTKIGFILSAKNIIANVDDKSFKDIKKRVQGQNLISYGLDNKADLFTDKIHETKKGVNLLVRKGKDKFKITSRFFGIYNVYNCLAAIGVLNVLQVDPVIISEAMRKFQLPTGRLEKIDVGQNFNIFVDFAHTPNALEETLKILRNRTKGRLIPVFGCAGERDKTKRIKMGEIATRYSDISIFTAEDPRSENVYKILSKMRQGALKNKVREVKFGIGIDDFSFKKSEKYFALIPERHEAIAFSLNKVAQKDDTVVFLGKGHEKTLAYDKFEHPWSDQEIVKNVLSNGKNIAAIVFAAGRGTRMASFSPKVLSKITGRPMISYSLENLRRSSFKEIILVVGYKKEFVIKETAGSVKFAFQEKTLGTAHAVAQGLKKVGEYIDTVVAMNGDDSAFYKPETIKEIISRHYETKSTVSFVSLLKDNPQGLGRVIRDKNNKLVSIIEEKDADKDQKRIKEVNDGLYVFEKIWLQKNVKKVKKSAVGEYYIVDLIKLALTQKRKVNVFRLENSDEWQGINTQEQLKEANMKMARRLSKWN